MNDITPIAANQSAKESVALSYARLGWHVLRTDGKIPVGKRWQTDASTETRQISAWFWHGTAHNIGVLLGPRSGIIDLEYDDPEGEATVNKLLAEHFPDGVTTPTFKSSRSTHRIFCYRGDLPPQAVIKIAGAEFRIGGGDKGAQTVFPPATGRDWLPGLSPADVPVVELPDGIAEFIRAGVKKSSPTPINGNGHHVGDRLKLIDRAKKYLAKVDPAISGQRGHDQCFSVACILRCRFGLGEEESLAAIDEWNARCEPPWSEHELRHKLADADKESKTLDLVGEKKTKRKRRQKPDAVIDLDTAAAGREFENRKKPEEATNDPHFLAREFLHKKCTNAVGEQTLVFWQDEFREHYGTCYRTLPTVELRARLSQFIKDVFDEENIALQGNPDGMEPGEEPPKCKKVTVSLLTNVLAALQSMTLLPGHISAPTWLDDVHDIDPADVMPTRSGLVVLPRITEENHLIEPTASLFTMNGVDYKFDPSAECPTWLNFLDSLWPQDLESIQTLQDWIGYLLLPDTRLHKMLMLIGPPRAGKGTIVRGIKGLIGENNLTFPKLSSFGGPFGLQPLLGKTVAIVTDARLSGRTDTIQVVENLLSISGEDPQDIHRKNLPTLTSVRLPVRFMMLTNELPNMRDSSGALLSRVILLRLTRSFLGKEDRTLDKRIAAELPGILNWALVGWYGVRHRGTFIQPDSGMELLGELRDIASPIQQFIRECCYVGPEFQVPVAELFRVYKWWAHTHNRENVSHDGLFGRDIRAALPSVTRSQPRTDCGRVPTYVGIGLRLHFESGTGGTSAGLTQLREGMSNE